jgi:hypothetical protein
MENILQPAPQVATPSEGANPTFKHVVLHEIQWVQDGLSDSAWELLQAYVRLAGPADRFNDRICRAGIAELMREAKFKSRSKVKRNKKELRAKLALEVIEREDPTSHAPQAVKIFSYKRTLAVWRQNKWTHVIWNRGVQFVTKLGDLIEMTLPKLPEFVKRAVDAAMAVIHKIAGPRRKAYVPAVNADAVLEWNEAATVAHQSAVEIWQRIQEELKPKILRQSFDTWIKPLKGWDVRDRVLYVKLPSAEFTHLGGKYAGEIGAAMATIQAPGVDHVEFLDRPPT